MMQEDSDWCDHKCEDCGSKSAFLFCVDCDFRRLCGSCRDKHHIKHANERAKNSGVK